MAVIAENKNGTGQLTNLVTDNERIGCGPNQSEAYQGLELDREAFSRPPIHKGAEYKYIGRSWYGRPRKRRRRVLKSGAGIATAPPPLDIEKGLNERKR